MGGKERELSRSNPPLATGATATIPSDERSNTVGLLIGHRYRVEKLLGEGSRKRTYLARDTKFEDRVVALSIVKQAAIALDPGGTQREADVLGRVGHHANVVSFHDASTKGSLQYIVFQHLSGGTLADYVARVNAQGNVVSNEQILRFSRQLGRALAHIHARRVIHRDVSPYNIWLDERLEAYLGDFDSAIIAGSSEKFPPLTTDAFASPEERRGDNIDSRSDIFSLGRVIAFLMTGHVQAAHQDVQSRSARPELPPTLHDLVGRMLAESSADRPADAACVLTELNELRHRPDVRSIIAKGEGERVEFKASFCLSYKVPANLERAVRLKALESDRRALEKAALKSIAGFLNSNGGTLLIGVDDAGRILGIEADFPMLGRKQNADGWQLYFRDCVIAHLDPDVWSNMRVAFEPVDGRTVARVDCIPRRSPTWLRSSITLGEGKQECFEFYVRSGSATSLLAPPDAVHYIVETGRAGMGEPQPSIARREQKRFERAAGESAMRKKGFARRLILRAPSRSNTYYQKIDALADRGAHKTYVHQVKGLPRIYGGQCFDCDWLGSETTGKGAMEEMLAHTASTDPSRFRRSPPQPH